MLLNKHTKVVPVSYDLSYFQRTHDLRAKIVSILKYREVDILVLSWKAFAFRSSEAFKLAS